MSGRIVQKYHRDVVGIAKTNKASQLIQSFNIHSAYVYLRIVGDEPHNLAVDSSQTGNEHCTKLGLQLQIGTLVYNASDDMMYIIGLFSVGRKQFKDLAHPFF